MTSGTSPAPTRRPVRFACGPLAVLLLTVLAAAVVGAGEPPSEPIIAESGEADGPRPGRRSAVAWSLLGDGRYFEALRHFARQAGLYPQDGNPKLGYAIAAAAAGDLPRGAKAMRRVLRTDPAALRDLSVDQELRPLVRRLTSLYLWRLERHADDQDAAVMLCGLFYLLRHEQSTQYAIDLVIGSGETGPAADNLQQLMNEWLRPLPPDPPSAEPTRQPMAEPSPEPTPGPEPDPVPPPLSEPEQLTAEPASSPVPESPAPPVVDTASAPVATPVADTGPPPADPGPVPTAPVVEVPGAAAANADVSADVSAWEPPDSHAAVRFMPPPIPERFPVDYEKLGEDITSVGVALESFTRRLMRAISESPAPK